MANRSECEICREMAAEKHKHDKVWKVVAIISTIIAVLFIILYFGSGEVITETVIENEVQIENSGDGNATNENIGNIGSDYSSGVSWQGGVIILAIVAVVGGVIYGCIAISQSNRKKQREGNEQVERREKNEDKH